MPRLTSISSLKLAAASARGLQFRSRIKRSPSRFVQALRKADVRVSPAETLDAFDILIENKILIKDAESPAFYAPEPTGYYMIRTRHA